MPWPLKDLINEPTALGLLGAALAAAWKFVLLGRRIGQLESQLTQARADITYIRDRIDRHFDQHHGQGGT